MAGKRQTVSKSVSESKKAGPVSTKVAKPTSKSVPANKQKKPSSK